MIESSRHLTFVGDIVLPKSFPGSWCPAGAWIGNLEGPITSLSVGTSGKINLKSAPGTLSATCAQLPVAVCLANNHTFDFGPSGLADSRAELRAAGIHDFGAGTQADQFGNPFCVDINGVSVAVMGYACASTHPQFAIGSSPGVAELDLQRVQEDLELARERGAGRTVVCVHWGLEQIEWPTVENIRLARRIIDMGADLMIGHHPHCIQASEVYRGRLIAYSLGNFLAPDVDVPTRFAEDGSVLERFKKKTYYWNNRGLAIEYDPISGSARRHLLHFDGHRVTLKEPDTKRFQLDASDLGRYERALSRRVLLDTVRDKVGTLLASPVRPQVRHFRSIARIISQARRSAAAKS